MPGVGTGWVYRVGNTGPYRPRPAARGEVDPPAKRAPDGPAGAGSGWVGQARTPSVRCSPAHPCGARSVPLGPPWLGPPLSPAPGQYGEISPHFP